MVLLGVVGEVICDWKDMGGRLARAKRFSAILLIVGLAIEFIEAAKSDKDVSAAIERAGNAEKQAGQANERAAKFEKEAADLFKVGEQAKESTAKAETELQKAEAGRLELEKQVLALVKKTNVRNISPETKTNLALQLKGVPKGNVEIVMSDKDPECMAFGLDIKKVLVGAGFENVAFSPRDIFRAGELFPEAAVAGTDLIFCVKDVNSPPLCSKLTWLCFRSGVHAEICAYNETLKDNDFQIFVLPKPVSLDK